MQIKFISLKNFKRFTDLTVQGLPETSRLVVLVGPNGSGKSSLFEAFNIYMHRVRNNNFSDTGYWLKVPPVTIAGSISTPMTTNVWTLYGNNVNIQFHGVHQSQALTSNVPDDADRKSFHIRTSYRHEGDFTVSSISKAGDLLDDSNRPTYLFSQESRVSANYQRMVALTLEEVYDLSLDPNTTRREIRERLVKQISESLQRVLPDLQLSGPGNPVEDGTFFFQKGTARDWKYKNLSGGERAAFDLLLDFAIKVNGFNDTVFCIDEPEVHMHTSVQAALLQEMLALLPPSCQLWIATHSAGMMRAARDLNAQRPGEVVFLDFGGRNFDEPVVMEPSIPDRAFWKRNFEIALGDMAHLVAPDHLVFCEGAANSDGTGFDATCYEKIFEREFPQVEFISSGGATEMQKNGFSMKAVMERIVPNVQITLLRDRDDCSREEAADYLRQGVRLLSRRTIESYLWDEEILTKLCLQIGEEDKIAQVLFIREQALAASRGNRGNQSDDVKSASGEILVQMKRLMDLRQMGNTTTAFARDTLAPLVTPDTHVYQELKRDIFGDG